MIEALDLITEPGRVRLTVDRTGDVHVETSPHPMSLARPRVAIDDIPVDPSNPILHHKTTNRTVYHRALARHPDADDVILVNDSSHVTETTIANLAVEVDGVAYTPPLDDGCLAGVMRAHLLDKGDLVERSLTKEDIMTADRVGRINALRGWEEISVMTEI